MFKNLFKKPKQKKISAPSIDKGGIQTEYGRGIFEDNNEVNSTLKITKDSNIGEIAYEYPHLAQVLAEDYGLHCISCFAASFDTLESGAGIHGMNSQEIDEMVIRLNKIQDQYLKKQRNKKQ